MSPINHRGKNERKREQERERGRARRREGREGGKEKKKRERGERGVDGLGRWEGDWEIGRREIEVGAWVS